MLTAMAHTYTSILAYLDALEDALPQESDWDRYTIVADCVSFPAKKFREGQPITGDVRGLCENLLGRIEGAFITNGFQGSEILRVFNTMREVALETSSNGVDWEHWLREGEQLSRACYLAGGSETQARLRRSTQLEIHPDRSFQVTSRLSRTPEPSRVKLWVALDQFEFEAFVNLPFFMLHECFSHLHPERVSGEEWGGRSAFEDGWLMFGAQRYFEARPSSPLTTVHYVNKYIYQHVAFGSFTTVKNGYWTARNLVTMAQSEGLYWSLTHRLAEVAYDCMPGEVDVHNLVVGLIKKQLTMLQRVPPEHRQAVFQTWREAIHRKDNGLAELIALLKRY